MLHSRPCKLCAKCRLLCNAADCSSHTMQNAHTATRPACRSCAFYQVLASRQGGRAAARQLLAISLHYASQSHDARTQVSAPELEPPDEAAPPAADEPPAAAALVEEEEESPPAAAPPAAAAPGAAAALVEDEEPPDDGEPPPADTPSSFLEDAPSAAVRRAQKHITMTCQR